ncbi:hypothetical protein ACJX0J_026239, partial [Zea mays]
TTRKYLLRIGKPQSRAVNYFLFGVSVYPRYMFYRFLLGIEVFLVTSQNEPFLFTKVIAYYNFYNEIRSYNIQPGLIITLPLFFICRDLVKNELAGDKYLRTLIVQ